MLLLLLGVVLGCCGLGLLAYGGLGAVMVHESQDDPWVVGSLALGAVGSIGAVVALVVGTVLLLRRPRP